MRKLCRKNVIDDIREYFKNNLGLNLKLYTASSERKNLTYRVMRKEESEKYEAVRDLLEYNKCPSNICFKNKKIQGACTEAD